MSKYKQTYIPSVTTTDIPKKSLSDMRKYVRDKYTSCIQGKTIKNKHTGLTIFFGSDGKGELAHGRSMHAKKAALVNCLIPLLENAEYNNFGQRKEKDEKNVFGYANFKAKAFVDSKLVNVRITVIVKNNGKAYYCHEISIKK